ncbi:MAG: hypothetical protein GY861_02430 [bacterium]|nr:hypothetical protein [bacterium]
MLTKQQVLDAAKELFLVDTDRRVYFKVVDYSGNPVAPEKTAYRLYFWDIFGKRNKFTYYPNTVGFQSRR